MKKVLFIIMAVLLLGVGNADAQKAKKSGHKAKAKPLAWHRHRKSALRAHSRILATASSPIIWHCKLMREKVR